MPRLGFRARAGLSRGPRVALDLAGYGVGGLLAGLALIRGGKAVHPHGIVYRARLVISGAPGAPRGSELLSTPAARDLALGPRPQQERCGAGPMLLLLPPVQGPRPRAATVSNKAIGERLVITEAAVRKHVGAIFAKLDLPSGDDAHRRILAVLVYLSRQRQGESIGL